ncbi:MAG: fasciclin domain-containing protein [Flavobacterium sp.]|nr:fasciclin domain-containing protein [Flavobacterium sp.]
MKNIKNIGLAIAAITTLASCERNSTYENVKPSIANIAVANESFSTLEAAAVKGGVAVVLSNSNPGDPSGHYTVFAPTNDAFNRLGLNENTLGVLNPTFLTNTLLYHVSNGDLASGSFTTPTASALSGLTRRFVKRGSDTYINGSKIVATDISAANGTVHAVDKVMIATGANIVNSTIAVTNGSVFIKPELTYLLAAILYVERERPAVGLVNALATSPALTVFAPTDQAFIDLGVALGLPPFTKPSDIEKINDPDLVKAVLFNHVFGGAKFTSEMNAGAQANLNGTNLTLGAFTNGVLTVKGPTAASIPANMVIPDIQTTNGVVHIIDRVLL